MDMKLFLNRKKNPKSNISEKNTEATQANILIGTKLDGQPFQYLLEGKGDIWDILSPDGIDLSHKNVGYLADSLAGERPFRTIYVTRAGWPRKLQTDWISQLLSVGEVDVTIYVNKISPRDAIKSLQSTLTMLKSNLIQEQKNGSIDQIHDLMQKIHDTEVLMEDISMKRQDYFHVSVLATIFSDNEEMLARQTTYLEDILGGFQMHIRSAYERMKQAFISALPRGIMDLEMMDTYRNLDRYSLTTMFPFASGGLKFKGGIPFAVNQTTGNLEFLNIFADDHMNYNVCVFGESGSGKTTTITSLVARATTLDNCKAVILDPEGEQKLNARRLGAVYIPLDPNSKIFINPCAITVTELEFDEEDEEQLNLGAGYKIVRKEDGKDYIRFVPIKDKISEILQFFNMIVKRNGTPLDTFEENYLIESIQEAFEDKGITTDPDSLYIVGTDLIDGRVIQNKILKPEITISDIYKILVDKYENEPNAQRIITAIKPWLRGGIWGMFDGQTNLGDKKLTDINKAKIIVFDISNLESNKGLRDVGYHCVLTWIWEKFVKNDQNALTKKIVLADEAWQMTNSEDTVDFAEKMARRCRKRYTSFIISSQDAERILNNEKMRSVVTNSSIQILLKQNDMNFGLMKEVFRLSEGELSIIMGKPEKGEGLLRVQGQSIHMRTDLSPFEAALFESNKAKRKQKEKELGISFVKKENPANTQEASEKLV